MNKLSELLTELRRNGWALFVAALGTLFILRSGREILLQQLGVLAWKVTLVGVAMFLSHTFRSQLFPYIDVQEALAKDPTNGGRVFLGICLLTGALILALCAGL